MSDLTEAFIRAYEQVVKEVNDRAGANTSHSFEIEKASNRDSFVHRHRDLMKYIRDVRHTLQHPKHRAVGHAVQISKAFLDEVQALLAELKNPPKASSVGVKRKLLRTAGKDDRLGDLASEMKAKAFSNIPILDDADVLIGVFNEAAVFDYLWSQSEVIIGKDMTISDIIGSCLLSANHTETFKFVKPTTPQHDLVEMFLAVDSLTTRVGAVFVTPSGNCSEPIHRLITPWDVLAKSAI